MEETPKNTSVGKGSRGEGGIESLLRNIAEKKARINSLGSLTKECAHATIDVSPRALRIL